jgi:hypothetical protein
MMIRAKGFRIGSVVRLHDMEQSGGGNAYPLPPGWQDRQVVTVTGFDHGWATVRDDAGRETQVFIACIDSGWEECVNGKWRGVKRGVA